MRRKFLSLIVFTIFFLYAGVALSVPNLINYRGVLNDGNGQPVTSTININFKIYDAAIGGNQLWGESQSVQVADGLFSVKLGSVQQLTTEVFEQDTLYLGIQVGADSEMVPRQQVTSGAFAIKAETTPNDEFVESLKKIRKWVLFGKETIAVNGTSIFFSSMPLKKRWKIYLQAAHQNPISSRYDAISIFFNNDKSASCFYTFHEMDGYNRYENPDAPITLSTNNTGKIPLVYSNGYYTTEDFVEFDFNGNLSSPSGSSHVRFFWNEQIGGFGQYQNVRMLQGSCHLSSSHDAVTEIEIAKDINDSIIVSAYLYYLDDIEPDN